MNTEFATRTTSGKTPAMNPRFPTLLLQSQIDSRVTLRALVLPVAPSLPWCEWLIAGVLLTLLVTL